MAFLADWKYGELLAAGIVREPSPQQLTWKGWEWSTPDGKEWLWADKNRPQWRTYFLDKRGLEDVKAGNP